MEVDLERLGVQFLHWPVSPTLECCCHLVAQLGMHQPLFRSRDLAPPAGHEWFCTYKVLVGNYATWERKVACPVCLVPGLSQSVWISNVSPGTSEGFEFYSNVPTTKDTSSVVNSVSGAPAISGPQLATPLKLSLTWICLELVLAPVRVTFLAF